MSNWYNIIYTAILDVDIMIDPINNDKFYDYVSKFNVDITDNTLYKKYYYLVFTMKEKYSDINIIEFCKFLDPFVLDCNDKFLGIIQSDYIEDEQENSLYGKLIMKGNNYYKISYLKD